MSDLVQRIERTLHALFPLNRSLTGKGIDDTFDFIKSNFFTNASIKAIKSGSNVFDWKVPDEWHISEAFVKNANGEKIIDIRDSNLHVVAYSSSVNKTVDKEELLNHLHTLPQFPKWTPYRTSYYKRDWGFCCPDELLSSDKFIPPFKVFIDSKHTNGHLKWLEILKSGESEKEILISTYACHPSLGNDNLSGLVMALYLFEYISSLDTRYSYRLIIIPETIGAIAFLSQANVQKIIGGMILSCVAGPGQVSIKEGFQKDHWINKAAHMAIMNNVGPEYTIYPFEPNGSDERQYSSPGVRINTPSIHKSKYYEYDQYHTSADDLDYISSQYLKETLDIHKDWIHLIESFCYPQRVMMSCEYQLGRRGLYPTLGGTLNQNAHYENKRGSHKREFYFDEEIKITGKHVNAFSWLMHLSDGKNSNFEISEKSGINIKIINEAINIMNRKKLLEIK